MSEHERGAYTPPTDAPLNFDPRQPVRGSRPIPITLIVSVLVLIGLGGAIAYFYQSGVRHAGEPPQTVGAPVVGMKAPPPAEAQPQDPAAGLQIYKTEGGKAASSAAPQFTPPPEQPQARALPPAPKVAMIPAAPDAAAPTLRPSIPAQPLAPARAAPAPKAEAPKPAPTTVAKVEAPKPAPAKAAPAPAKPVPAKPEPKAAAAPAPAAKTAGVAAVQIGAFSSQALADKGWSDAAAVSPGLAAGKGKSVEKVDKDGKTLFRTQVTGFSSRAAATAFCDKLKAAGKACFVK
jgi:hypothetical protein